MTHNNKPDLHDKFAWKQRHASNYLSSDETTQLEASGMRHREKMRTRYEIKNVDVVSHGRRRKGGVGWGGGTVLWFEA
jgi:hypothetical protein